MHAGISKKDYFEENVSNQRDYDHFLTPSCTKSVIVET